MAGYLNTGIFLIKMTNEMALITIKNEQTVTARHVWVRHRATSDALKTTPERREVRAEVCYCRP